MQAHLVPYRVLSYAAADQPLLRYPWSEIRESVQSLASDPETTEVVQLACVNPLTGRACLLLSGFSAIMLRSGEPAETKRYSASPVIHVIGGKVNSGISGSSLSTIRNNTIPLRTHAQVTIVNRSSRIPAFLFQVDNAPMQDHALAATGAR